MEISKDTLGDRLKALEQQEAGRKASRNHPLMARLDGKAFHTFTRGLQRPYDVRLSQLMIDTTKYLVEHTHATIGYTQSDEISLFWDVSQTDDGQYLYDGKYQKMTSVLASMAGAYFARELPKRIPEKAEALPCFDCRVWNVPNMKDVFLNFLWRQDDAIKNSISMAAQAHYSHHKLNGVDSESKKQMLHDVGHPWEDEPLFFKMGTFVQRLSKLVTLTDEQLAKIPEKHRPTEPVLRTSVEELTVGYLKDKDVNVGAIFGTII